MNPGESLTPADTGTREPTANPGKPRLLAVGYWATATGFTRVLQSIFARLSDRYDIHVIGLSYKGPVLSGDITVYPCNLKGGDVFGVSQACDFVERLRPELVFLLNDIWIVSKYLPLLAPYQPRTRIVCYFPLDGRLVDNRLLLPFAALAPPSRLVVYTRFASEEILRVTSEAGHGEGQAPSLDPLVIPHGVDGEAFYPLSGSTERQVEDDGRLAARRLCFPAEPDLEGSFFVLNANRPQPRKRIDLTLQGFAIFARDKPPNVKLVLHHAIIHAEEQVEVQSRIDVLGIGARVIRSSAGESRPADAELNLIYNACDVGINTAMGEGWGLISFEHAATGAAQIVPRHSACAELWAGAAVMMEPAERYIPRFSRFEMQAVSPEGVAAALERLYSHREHRNALALAAYRNATQPRYRWDTIAGQWGRLFDDLLAAEGPLPTRQEGRVRDPR